MANSNTQTRQKDDCLIPVNAQLLRPDLTVVDVSTYTVYFKMVSAQGVTKVAKTTSGVNVIDAATGLVSYTFEPEDVDTAGTYYGYFIAEGGVCPDTFPAETGGMKIQIKESA
jgi:hypothetical protein